jgi:hypothetical protein
LVTLDELDVEIHLVNENVVLSPESRSHEKFMHGIKVLMAKNYVENLGEETKKGMAAKAKQGIWPSFAPPGYRNVTSSDGKRTIEPDPIDGPVITRLFERFATGTVSIKMLAREFPAIRGRRFFPAQIHQACTWCASSGPSANAFKPASKPCTSIASMAVSLRSSSMQSRMAGLAAVDRGADEPPDNCGGAVCDRGGPDHEEGQRSLCRFQPSSA